MNDAGLIVVTAFISPYREDRLLAQHIICPDRFFEIYVSTPIATCEARDPKGMYKRARAGEIQGFTGVGAPYEPPGSPTMEIDTSVDTLPEYVVKVLSGLVDRIAIPGSDKENTT